jgi:hypothetical protein
MKIFITLIIILTLYDFGYCQDKDSLSSVEVNTEVTVATRNIWRGLDYGSAPSIQGTLSVRKNNLEIGAWGTTTLNGSKRGYGTWMELFATAYWKNWSFTVDDYFFFNEDDADNNYFEWDRKKTQHFIEGRIKYTHERFSVMGGYAFFKNTADHTTGVYLEAEYFITSAFSLNLGGVTDASWLSFYDRGGITTVGFSGRREIPIGNSYSIDLKASLIANPNHNGSVNATGVGTNPIYFVVYLTF